MTLRLALSGRILVVVVGFGAERPSPRRARPCRAGAVGVEIADAGLSSRLALSFDLPNAVL